jgi:predicted nucleic-acid-binding protein
VTDTSPVCAVDTNFILRYLAQDVPSQFEAAHGVLADLSSGSHKVECDPVILAEVVYVLTSHYELSRQETAELVIDLVRARGFILPNKDRYIRALRLFAESVPHFADACACAAAMELAEGRLYSFDKKLSRVQGLTRLEEAAGQ